MFNMMFDIRGDFMEIFSNMLERMENDPGRPERPFPLQPAPGLLADSPMGFPLDADCGFPVTDETDFILMRSDNISLGHTTFDAFEILSAQSARMEGDSYGR